MEGVTGRTASYEFYTGILYIVAICVSSLQAIHLPQECPYNLTGLDFVRVATACNTEVPNSSCCRQIDSLVAVAASRYANASGYLCLTKQLETLCLNSIFSALDFNGVHPQASRVCRIFPLHCPHCGNITTLESMIQQEGYDDILYNCNGEITNCDRCAYSVGRFASNLNSSYRACREAASISLLAHLGDSHSAVHQMSCLKQSDCPLEFAPWQLENIENVCKSGSTQACCSLSLLILRISASRWTRSSGIFFVSQKQARMCINDFMSHTGRHGICPISADSIFNVPRRGCNNVLTATQLRQNHPNVNFSHILSVCGQGTQSCGECRRAAMDAAYAAAWPYMDANTIHSCMDLTFIMLSSLTPSLTVASQIAACLYDLPVYMPPVLDEASSPAYPPSQGYSSTLTSKTHSFPVITVVLVIGVGITSASVALLFILLLMQRQRVESTLLWSKLCSDDFEVRSFKYKELQRATYNFQNIIGKGKGGITYKASFKDGLVAAVKRLRIYNQDYGEFKNEIQFLKRLHHRHLLSLRGFCIHKRERFLVYDYMENGSLMERLHFSSSTLSWQRRMQIAVEVATGLEYVHCYCEPPISHGNIKSSNILLDDKLVAKVGDFRLSTTDFSGTPGYTDPEYTVTGTLSEKSDVYSYGVLLLELISARPVIGRDSKDILDWAHEYYISDTRIMQMVDPKLAGRFDISELKRIIKLARLCTQEESKLRPTMKQVVNLLLDNNGVAFPPLCFTTTGPMKYERYASDDMVSVSSVSIHSAATLPSLNSNKSLYLFGVGSSSFDSNYYY